LQRLLFAILSPLAIPSSSAIVPVPESSAQASYPLALVETTIASSSS
jgi:hypothetical protein